MQLWLSLLTSAAVVTAPAPDDHDAAIESIRALGGSVMKVSQKDDLYDVDFHLEGREVGDDGLTKVAALGKVARLNLASTKVTDAGLAHLAGLESLTHLYLQHTSIRGDGLQHLAGLPNLVYVNLYGSKVNDAGLAHLQGCSKLQHVFLWQTEVTTDGALALLAALPELNIDRGADAPPLRIKREYSEEKAAAAIAHVESIGGAVHRVSQDSEEVEVDLHLGRGEIKDDDLAVLVEIPHLVGLHLGGTTVTDAGLRHVAELWDLRRLHLENTEVSDAGVAHLKGLNQLAYLNLFHTKVGDGVVDTLHGMKGLRKVFLWQTSVTAEAADGLRSGRPNLHVDTGWVATLAVAADELPADATCCQKAKHANKECEHPCCVAAAKEGRTCFKCNPLLAKTCCEKAEAAGNECGHPCCVEARKNGKLCEKCNPAG